MFKESIITVATEKPKRSDEKSFIQTVEQFEGNLEEFFKFCRCDFVLEEEKTEKNQEKERAFFENIIKKDISPELLKAFIDKIIKRERTALLGAKITGEKNQENLDFEEIHGIADHFLEKLFQYDKNQTIIKKILEIYPYYCLGDEQPLIFTDSLVKFLEKYGKEIDKAAQVKMMVDFKGNIDINTRTFEMHEDDFWDMNEIVFKKNNASFGKYLEKKESQIESDPILNLKVMNFCYESVIQRLSIGQYLGEIKEEYGYIKKQIDNENYIVSARAKSFLDIIESAIFEVEDQALSFVCRYNEDFGKTEIVHDFYDEKKEKIDVSKILNWNNLTEEEKIYYYSIIYAHPPQLTPQEMEIVEYASSWPTDEAGNSREGESFFAPLAKDLTGKYSAQGKLLCSFEKGDEKNRNKAIDNEELTRRFFERQRKSAGVKDFFRDVDENYLFFVFSDLYIRKKIEEDFGINFSQFSLFEQKQFFYFLRDADGKKTSQIKNILTARDSASKRIDVVRSFLSLEIDKQNGNRIIEIAKKLSRGNADQVFAKIAEIIDKTEMDLSELINLEDGEIDPFKIQLELLRKAHQIILDFSGEEKDTEKLLADLENSKIQIDLLSSLLKAVKEQGIKITPENINDFKMETFEVGELRGEKKREFREKYEKAVMEMMRKSYAKIFEENPAAQAKVERSFQKRFENLENYRVYALMFQGEAAAFSVIDSASKDCAKGEAMSESTIVHPDVARGALGIAFLKKIFEEEFKKYQIETIRGKVRKNHPAGKSYDAIGLLRDENRPEFFEEGVEYEWRAVRKS